jgi:sugar/nucleoside kinase (ribokinase family)
MKSKYDLVCVGDVVVDAFIGLQEASVKWDAKHENPTLSMPFATKIPYQSLVVIPAVGNASNVAVGAARLGLNTGMLASIGGDQYGRDILDVYRKEGVNAEFIRVNKNLPTNYHFVLTYQAERTILIKHQDFEYYDPRKLDAKTDWLYFSSIGPNTLPFHKHIGEYLKRHPNVRMGFNPGTFQLRFGLDKIKEIYKHTYVVFVNKEEAEQILKKKPGTDMKVLFEGMHKLGPKVVCITDGPAGAYASDGVSRYYMPLYPDPKPPVSRTGAGDAFSTGFLCALIYGLPIHEALRWAPVESMHVVQFFGAQAGLLSKPALLSFLKKAPKKYVAKAI